MTLRISCLFLLIGESSFGLSCQWVFTSFLLLNRTDSNDSFKWEMISEEQVMHYHYPSDDLMFHLVDNFFTYLNPYLPILHRPSFDRALRERSHHTDIGFGSVVLLVCALGARWSEDARVFIDNTSSHSAGWKYFDQVHTLRRSLLAPPRLYDLQIYAVRKSST